VLTVFLEEEGKGRPETMGYANEALYGRRSAHLKET
jgi:hypothetical protein